MTGLYVYLEKKKMNGWNNLGKISEQILMIFVTDICVRFCIMAVICDT